MKCLLVTAIAAALVPAVASAETGQLTGAIYRTPNTGDRLADRDRRGGCSTGAPVAWAWLAVAWASRRRTSPASSRRA